VLPSSPGAIQERAIQVSPRPVRVRSIRAGGTASEGGGGGGGSVVVPLTTFESSLQLGTSSAAFKAK